MKLLAALIFFTRLPFWRIAEVPAEHYKRVVDLWSATGWLTGGITALTLFGAFHLLPPPAAVTVALTVRLLVTGALHEDGLADFFDGMGGGTSRSRILAIMKDSHIGTYGVIALIIYFILAVTLLSSLPPELCCLTVLAADPWSKFCASQIINFLPYARKQEEAKNLTVYSRMGAGAWLASFLFGALPLALLPHAVIPAAITPLLVSGALIIYMKSKLQGYTGDCCGATFLMSELSFFLTVTIIS